MIGQSVAGPFTEVGLLRPASFFFPTLEAEGGFILEREMVELRSFVGSLKMGLDQIGA
jgi:hypothetical protein